MSLPINVNRFQNKVRALLGMRGENPVPTLDELSVSLSLEQDRVEWGFAGNEFYGGVVRTQALVAGQFSYVAIVNPALTGVLVVVEDILSNVECDLYIASPADVAAVPPYLAGETATVGVFERDLRIPAGGVFAARASTGSQTVIPWRGPLANFLLGRELTRYNVMIPPGRALIAAGIAAGAIRVTFLIRERAIERGIGS
jgi:hypothetical protein